MYKIISVSNLELKNCPQIESSETNVLGTLFFQLFQLLVNKRPLLLLILLATLMVSSNAVVLDSRQPIPRENSKETWAQIQSLMSGNDPNFQIIFPGDQSSTPPMVSLDEEKMLFYTEKDKLTFAVYKSKYEFVSSVDGVSYTDPDFLKHPIRMEAASGKGFKVIATRFNNYIKQTDTISIEFSQLPMDFSLEKLMRVPTDSNVIPLNHVSWPLLPMDVEAKEVKMLVQGFDATLKTLFNSFRVVQIPNIHDAKHTKILFTYLLVASSIPSMPLIFSEGIIQKAENTGNFAGIEKKPVLRLCFAVRESDMNNIKKYLKQTQNIFPGKKFPEIESFLKNNTPERQYAAKIESYKLREEVWSTYIHNAVKKFPNRKIIVLYGADHHHRFSELIADIVKSPNNDRYSNFLNLVSGFGPPLKKDL